MDSESIEVNLVGLVAVEIEDYEIVVALFQPAFWHVKRVILR